MLRAMRESGGTAVAVPDEAMVEGCARSAAPKAISAAPEGGAALAAIKRLVADRLIRRDDVVVLFNTGGALKNLDVLAT